MDSVSDRHKENYEEGALSSPDKLQLSEKLSPVGSSFSFDEDREAPIYRGKAANLLDSLTKYIEEATKTFKELSQPFASLFQAKASFLKLVEREIDRELQEKKFELERFQENISYVLNELRNHKKTVLEAISTNEGLTESFVQVVRERAEKTISMFVEEKNRNFSITLDLEIVSKSGLKELKDRNRNLNKELDRQKLRNQEFTPDTARHRPRDTNEDQENLEEIDNIICQRIKEMINLLQSYSSSSRPHSFAFASTSPEFDPYYPLKCFDTFRLLEQKLISILKSQAEKLKRSESESERLYTSIKRISPGHSFKLSEDFKEDQRISKEIENANTSNSALSRINQEQAFDIQEFKKKLQALTQENFVLKQKLAASKSHETELSIALRNQELSFEEKLSDIKAEAQNDMIKMQEAFEKMCEENTLRTKILELEDQLEKSKKFTEFNANTNFEREIDNVRKIYNDKYEELFRITSVQINELEQKLIESNFSKQAITEEIRANVRKEEAKLKEQEFHRLSQLHKRELRLVQCEFEDFLEKSKSEIKKLGKLVEKAIQSSDAKLLNSLQDDIQEFQNNIQTKEKKIRDESFSIIQDERICKRCGLNDEKSRHCNFHPYLAGPDAQEFLYNSDWHKCRENNHSSEDPPCVKTSKHCYNTESSNNLIRVFESFNGENLTFAKNPAKTRSDTPSRALHEALFSTSKKDSREATATDLLDSYISKYNY